MRCPGCGKELGDNAKFCDVCGAKIEAVVPEQNEGASKVEEPTVNVNTAADYKPIENVQETASTVVQNDTVGPKKKSNTALFVVLGVVLAAIAVCAVLFAMGKSSKGGNIESLEKALSNTVNSGDKSGTIVATISMGDDKDSIDLSALAKYQMLDDNVKFQLTVNKSMFFDEMSLYGNVSKSSADLYAKTSLIDMFMSTTSDKDGWVKLNVPLDELDLDNIDVSEIEKTDGDLSLDYLKENIKYVGKKDGFDCYTLVIDNALIEKVQKDATEEQKQMLNQSLGQLSNGSGKLEKPYNIDFYVRNNKIQKIVLDMEEYAKDLNMKKLMLTIEFKDPNSTVVEIPNEAVTSSVDLETYISENSSGFNFNFDDDDLDFDSDDLSEDDFDFGF